MPRYDKPPTFWEMQAEFVHERGISATRKEWTRADDSAWGRFRQAREWYWSLHRQWVDSLKHLEERRTSQYLQLLHIVGFAQNPAWIDRRIRTYLQEQMAMKALVDEPVFADEVSKFYSQWDAQDRASEPGC